MNWFIAALISTSLYAASNAITKGFAPRLSLLTGLLFFTIGAFLAVALGFLATKSPFIRYTQGISLKALWGMMASGFLWAWATYVFFQIISKNIALSLALPLIVGGIGVGAVVAGVLLFGETLTATQIGAVVLVIIGSILLGRG